jgi:hypothetical protein
VNNFTNIHDSLEASTAHEHIHACSQSDLQTIQQQQLAVRKSGQERWFTKLPPVLFFELSRYSNTIILYYSKGILFKNIYTELFNVK